MNMKYSALICAAGSGTRMKLGYNKVYAKLNDGQMIIDKTINVFLNDRYVHYEKDYIHK